MGKRVGIVSLIVGILLIVVGVVWQILDMLIDHQCYQLEPNDFYIPTICERYWKK